MSIAVEVSVEAQTQVRELIKDQKPGVAVRVFLQTGGGCGCGSGGGGCGCGGGGGGGGHTTFAMAFDEPRNGDEVVQIDGFSIVADHATAGELDGAKIDFVQTLDATGFQIIPPTRAESHEHAEAGGCNCGAGGCGSC